MTEDLHIHIERCLFHQVECSFKEYEKKGARSYLHSERSFLFPTQKKPIKTKNWIWRKKISIKITFNVCCVQGGGKWKTLSPNNPSLFLNSELNTPFLSTSLHLRIKIFWPVCWKRRVSKSTLSRYMGPLKLPCWSLF